MDVAGLVTWVVAGLGVGWLAGIVRKNGGFGFPLDLVMAVVGAGVTVVGGGLLGAASALGTAAMAVVTFMGAASVVVVQRTFWPAPPVVRPQIRPVPRW